MRARRHTGTGEKPVGLSFGIDRTDLPWRKRWGALRIPVGNGRTFREWFVPVPGAVLCIRWRPAEDPRAGEQPHHGKRAQRAWTDDMDARR